jgi:hypothetical protein
VLRFPVWAISVAFRPRVLRIAENLCLRQQLLVLQRRHPRLRNAERRFWIIASRYFGGRRDSLLIVKPETVLRWHRRGWRAYRSWLSRRQWGRGGRRSIPRELQALIRRITIENQLWGQKRIQAELARLGFTVSVRTVAKYMNQRSRGRSGQKDEAEMLNNHKNYFLWPPEENDLTPPLPPAYRPCLRKLFDSGNHLLQYASAFVIFR